MMHLYHLYIRHKHKCYMAPWRLSKHVSVFGPRRAIDRQVNLCCVLHNPDCDAKRIYGGLSWFGQRRPTSSGGVFYFLAPKCLCRGYKLWEREPVPSLQKRVKMECCFRCWSLEWKEHLSSSSSCSFSVPLWRTICPLFYRVKRRPRGP
jgi:hypothetical protein